MFEFLRRKKISRPEPDSKCDLSQVAPHLIASLTAEEIDPLLADWRWRIGDDTHPLFLTASGDVFLADPRGGILWLNTGEGTVTPVADSSDDFQKKLRDAATRDNYFFAPAINRLRQSGKTLSLGQCYGFIILPILGGDWEGENRFPVSAKEHLSLTGHIHGQTKDLPEGTKVRLKFVD
jgi:hypothetical protein